ncbi:MAG: Cna B-type domain-containing protein [Erysipelotrichaceae bacterium]|nr:Cna B-type domain-containing protein [Erysipelotrichaceae bacterium]
MSFAAACDEPAHSKTSTPNGDGTQKIELTVTGDADDDVSEAGNVNVLVIYDVSQSMTNQAGSSSNSRADEAEDVMHKFLTDLAGYQNAKKDNINVALVTFAVTATEAQGWTTDVQGLADTFDEGTGEQNANDRYNYSYTGMGTNWDHALRTALPLIDTDSDIPTFVVMLTDGAPTADGNSGNNPLNPQQATLAQLRARYSAACTPAYNVAQAATSTGGNFYGIYSYGTEADLLDDLMYYSQNNDHRGGSINNVTGETVDTPNYYNAGNTAALQSAIDEIFKEVINTLGIAEVSISDGTTNQVKASSGEVTELLGVDEDSYQYWLYIPVTDNQFKRTMIIDGKATEVTYTVTDNGDGTCTVTWKEGTANKSVTVDGSVSDGQLKYEWTEANDLYNYDPPKAELVDGAVDWDLSSVGTLLSGVTYSVTFDVYPSQTALDYKARLDNGEAYNDVVPAEARDYFDANGNLDTNTEGTLSYTDTRTGDGPQTAGYTNPPALETESSKMTVKKEWEGADPPTLEKGLDLDVLMDDEEDPFYVANVNSPSWQTQFNISCGLIKGEEALEDAQGHDFSFSELGDEQYRWELHAPTVRPMLINGSKTPTILIKEDAENGYEAGDKKTYTIDGATYYVDPEISTLLATNHRRSNLNLTKVVDGTGAPEDAKFPFTLVVNNSKAPEEEPANDPNHNSDYWVWFSIRDAEGNAVTTDANVSNATQSGNYFYAKSGDSITLDIQAGWNLRFTNLPTGTTYTFEEGNTTAFKFAKAELTQGTDESFSGDKTSTGTIEKYDAESYEVTYTNEYAAVDFTVKKVWDDGNNQDKTRPSSLTLTLNGLPEGVAAPTPEVVKDGDTWTYTWKGLPKYNDEGGTITYTASEDNVPAAGDGTYECTGSPASDGGEITNTYEPKTIDIPVKKVWEGPEGDEVTVTLYADGKETDNTLTLNAGNEWKGTFESLPVNNDGDPIAYSVVEDGVTGVDADKYSTSISGSADEEGFTITNTYNPSPADSLIEGEKVLENYDGSLPTGKFFFTIEGTSFEPAESEETEQTDEEAAQADEGDATTEEAAEGSEDAESAQKAIEEAKADVVEAKEAKEAADAEVEEAKMIAEELVDQDDPEAEAALQAVKDAEANAEAAAAAVETAEAAVEDAEASVEETPAVVEETTEAANTEATTAAVQEVKKAVEEATPEVKAAAEEDEDVEIPLPDETKVTNDSNGKIAFGEIKFEKAGTYTYTITESGSMENVTNDPESTKTVTVVVTADENGDLTATIDPEDGPHFTFTNTYEAPDPGTDYIDPPVKKVIEGPAPENAETYTFKLEALDESNPMPEAANGSSSMTMDITGEGEKEFGKIVFTKDDAGNVYDYTVTEVAGDNADCEYDGTVYAVRAYVSVKDGKLKVKREYYKDGEQIDTATFKFVNTYAEEDDEEEGEGVTTGDDTNMLGGLLALILSAAGLAGAFFFRRREQN